MKAHEMKNHRHCKICKYVDAQLSEGIFCSLTDERPNFKTSCLSFKISDDCLYELRELGIEFERIESKQKRFTPRLYLMLFIGLVLIALGIYLFMVSPKSRFGIELSALICGIGFTIWSAAFIQRANLSKNKYRLLNKIEWFKEVLRYYKN